MSSYQILVEKVPDGPFSATVIGVPDCIAEGSTKEEALENASARLQERLAKGELFTIEIPLARTANPWLEIHGSLADDPRSMTSCLKATAITVSAMAKVRNRDPLCAGYGSS